MKHLIQEQSKKFTEAKESLSLCHKKIVECMADDRFEELFPLPEIDESQANVSPLAVDVETWDDTNTEPGVSPTSDRSKDRPKPNFLNRIFENKSSIKHVREQHHAFEELLQHKIPSNVHVYRQIMIDTTPKSREEIMQDTSLEHEKEYLDNLTRQYEQYKQDKRLRRESTLIQATQSPSTNDINTALSPQTRFSLDLFKKMTLMDYRKDQ